MHRHAVELFLNVTSLRGSGFIGPLGLTVRFFPPYKVWLQQEKKKKKKKPRLGWSGRCGCLDVGGAPLDASPLSATELDERKIFEGISREVRTDQSSVVSVRHLSSCWSPVKNAQVSAENKTWMQKPSYIYIFKKKINSLHHLDVLPSYKPCLKARGGISDALQ